MGKELPQANLSRGVVWKFSNPPCSPHLPQPFWEAKPKLPSWDEGDCLAGPLAPASTAGCLAWLVTRAWVWVSPLPAASTGASYLNSLSFSSLFYTKGTLKQFTLLNLSLCPPKLQFLSHLQTWDKSLCPSWVGFPFFHWICGPPWSAALMWRTQPISQHQAQALAYATWCEAGKQLRM